MGRNKVTFCKGHKINNGRTLTEEHKEKIRAGILRAKEKGAIGHPKGMPSWNKGLSKANGDILTYGKPRSDETKRKMSIAATGKNKSEKHKKNLVAALKGKRCSPKSEFKKGMMSLRKGVTLSDDVKKKISEGGKGKHIYTPELLKKILTRRDRSSLEKKFNDIIEKHKLPYKFVGNGEFVIGRKNPDFININGQKIAIEVYARYFKLRHSETIEEWKENRRKVFKEYGWSIIFFDETQVNEQNILQQLGGM